jgi:adenylate kinase
VHLDVPRSLAVGRLLERGRHDDTPATIGRRMSEHAREEGPLRAWFEAAGVLVQVDGVGSPDDVAERVWDAMAAADLADLADPSEVAAAS